MSEIDYYVLDGIACSIWKHDMGHLCGYIGLPPSHPWHGKEYDDIEADVHGGLTFAESETECRRPLHPIDWEKGPEWELVEKPTPYPHDTGLGLWWIGFDCAHLRDLVPGLSVHDLRDTYKDEAYVRKEIEGLVRQAR